MSASRAIPRVEARSLLSERVATLLVGLRLRLDRAAAVAELLLGTDGVALLDLRAVELELPVRADLRLADQVALVVDGGVVAATAVETLALDEVAALLRLHVERRVEGGRCR